MAVTGATGLIGLALVDRLRSRGHRVRRLVHSSRLALADDVIWDSSRDPVPATALAGVDAIVHLAGAPIGRRWTAAHKRAIRESRLTGTAALARAIAALDAKPAVLLNASAVGYYGDRGDDLLDESAPAGTDFLARLTADWEAATAPAADAGVRVVLLRTGVVLSPRGGALARMITPFRFGVGGPLGDGRQWMSWIALEDHLRAMEHALSADRMRGPVNLVSPNPVRSAQLAATLGRVLARPAWLPVPAVALELLFGEMARATLLASQRALPLALSAAGFEFTHPTVEGALRAMLA